MISLLSRIGICLFLFCTSLSGAQALTATHPKDKQLSPTALAEVILGEIALQRNLYADAWFAFLDASRLTSEQELADKAYRIALAMKDQSKATQARKVLDRLDPKNAQFLLEDALKQCQAGNHKKTLELLKQAAKKSDDPIWLFEQFAIGSEQFSDKTSRYALLKEFRNFVGENALVERQLAYAAKSANLEKDALSHALTAVKLAPGDTQILLESVDFEFPLFPEKAKMRLVSHLKTHPQDIHARIAYAKTLARTNHREDAGKELQRAISSSPSDAQVYFLSGIVAQEMKSLDVAVDYFNHYLTLVETDTQKRFLPDPAYIQLGIIALMRNEQETALNWFSRVERGDKYIPARLKQVEILEKLGRIDEACQILTALRTNRQEQRADFFFLAGQILSKAERKTEAMKYFDTALELAPNNASFLYRSAMVSEQIGWLQQAEKRLKRFIALRPEDPLGYNSLGYMWLDKGIRTKEAKPLIEKAMQLSGGKDGSIVDSMGWLKYREGKYVEAEKWLRKALSLHGEDPEIVLHLAQALIAQKRYDQARELLVVLIRNYPDNAEANTLLEKLSK